MNPEDKIQTTLSELLNQLQNNQSILTTIARTWSNIPFMSKATFNVVLIAGLVLCALFGPIGLFLGLAATALAYAGGSFLLNNHAENSFDDRVRNRILSLGGLITEVTGKLNTIKADLNEEVCTLREENVSLRENLQSLDGALSKNKKISIMLKNMVDNLSDLAIDDAQSREQFKDNLNKFQENNQIYSNLLNRQESQLSKLGLFRHAESKEKEESRSQLKLVRGHK